MRIHVLYALVLLINLIFGVNVCKAQSSVSQALSTANRPDIELQSNRAIESKITKQNKKNADQDDKEVSDDTLDATDTVKGPDAEPTKVYVKQIRVSGASLLSAQTILDLTLPYEDKELTFKEIQKIADLISDVYRNKGYVTSRAFIPPQNIKDGTLEIRVVEGRLGNIEVQGNRNFKSSLIRNKIRLRPQGYFDYSALQRSLVYINEHPDRVAKAILMPGQEPGTTDVVVDVKDRMPIHVGLSYDNYASKYLGKNRYGLDLEHNNLLGFDDKFYAKFQGAGSNNMKLGQARYVFPVNQRFTLGIYGVVSEIELGKEFKDLEAKGKSQVYGIFAGHSLVRDEKMEVYLNYGFDYKQTKNYLLGEMTSKDDIRVLKASVDVDMVDALGRTIVSPGIDVGIPDILGGMSSHDAQSSRYASNATSKFQKGLLNLYRLQPLPLSNSLLWKNSAQITGQSLTSGEQFVIGGPSSVRGYPVAEYAGDSGLYSSLEWSIPGYFIPQEMRVPLTQEKLIDALRLVLFYDLGYVNLKNPSGGERENRTLRGWGYGVRLNIKDNLSCRLEIGRSLGEKPSDGKTSHPWVEVISKF